MSAKYLKLSAYELKKRDWRLPLIIKKINDSKPFLLMNGNEVKVRKEKTLLNMLSLIQETGNYKMMNDVEFTTTDYKKFGITDMAKSTEFGGKGEGSGTVAEDRALLNFRELIQEECRKKATPYIKIKIGNRTVNVKDIQKVKEGMPKADWEAIDEDNNPVAYFSHKDGRTAKDFQQYGGLVELDKKFPNNKEILAFTNKVKNITGGEMKSGQSFESDLIKDKKLILATVYGIDYDKSFPSTQNVDMFIQGTVKLTDRNKNYIIESNHTGYKGEIPTGDYAVNLFVRYDTSRTNFDVKKARFMTKAVVGIKSSKTIKL